jgi:AraC-like DNA-binding protein
MRHLFIPTLRSVHADNGGLGIFSPGWIHPDRVLTSSVLLLGIRGRVPLTIDGETHDLIPGRILVLPAGFRHSGASPLGEGASYYWLHFTLPEPATLVPQDEADTILGSEGVANHLLEDAAFLPLPFDLPEPGPIADEFRDLLNQQEKPSYTGWKFQLQFQGLLIALTEAVIAAHRPPPVASPATNVVYGILACVAERVTDPNLSIKTIADELGLNPDYAGRRFKQVMGLSVGDYLLRQRIQLAVHRLERHAETLDDVAAACGFGTVRHFLRQFKAQTGTTPTEIRLRYRRMHINSI